MKQAHVYGTCKRPLQISESQSDVPDGMLIVEGVLAVVDVRNKNGRVYARDEYKRHIDALQPMIQEGLLGELEHPKSMVPDPERATHRVLAVSLNETNGEVYGKFLLLDTPLGKICQSIARSGVPLRASSRGRGRVNESGQVTLDLLRTYDIVKDPGFYQTAMRVNESVEDGIPTEMTVHYIFESDLNSTVESADLTAFNNLNEQYAQLKQQLTAMQARLNESVVAANVPTDGVLTAADVQTMIAENRTALETMIADGDARLRAAVVKNAADTGRIFENWIDSDVLPAIQIWITEQLGAVNDEAMAAAIMSAVDGARAELSVKIEESKQSAVQKALIAVGQQVGPVVENWVRNTFAPELVQELTSGNKRTIQESLETMLNDNLIPKHIQPLLESAKRPERSFVQNIDEQYQLIMKTESRTAAQIVDESVPAYLSHIWAVLNESVKAEVKSRAALRDLSTPTAVNSFWKSQQPYLIQESLSTARAKQQKPGQIQLRAKAKNLFESIA